MKSFVDLVKEYSAWKLQEKGNGKLTRAELTQLRETYNKQAKSSNALREAVTQYRAWKKETKGTDKISKQEFEALKESLKQRVREDAKPKGNDWNVYVTNYKKFKESKEGDSKITYKELKMLKENFKEAQDKRIRLREADAGFDPAAAPVAGDPNAMAAPGADPNAMPGAAGAVDPTVAAQIQDVVQSVNALAASAGVQVNDLGADPAAGVPPVDGMQQPADPNAAAPVPGAPMMEKMIGDYKAWKKANKGTDKLTEAELAAIKEEVAKQTPKKTRYEQIKERIADRQAKLAALNEGYLDIPSTPEMGTLTSKPHVSNSHGGDHAVSEEQVKVPTPTQLASGYSSGKAAGETKPGKTWPTKAMGKEAGGALQGAGASQTQPKGVKESEECDEPKEDQLKEGVKTVTDVYVDRYFEPRLSFDRIKESMKKGLLG